MSTIPVPIGRIGELRPGQMAEVVVAGNPVAICNVDGALFAINGRCPHRGAPLAHGTLHGHIIVCPWHAWEFDCRTGLGDCQDVEQRAVRVEEGIIYLDA